MSTPREISEYARPTGRLRWKDGVLQQEWSSDWGPLPIYWEDVPQATPEAA